MASQYYIPPFNSTLPYKRFDVVYGIDIAGTTHASPYFYATVDVAAGYSPSGVYNYPITAYSRSEDVTTLTYTHTGGPPFGAGSIIRVTGMANTSVNYTGMITVGGSGTISFLNPGYSQSAAVTQGAINCHCPAWSTGFIAIPDYGTKVPTQMTAIVTQFGGGYSQRMGQGLNGFNQNPTFVYKNRDGRELKAIVNYVQSTDGVRPFEVLLPDAYLTNQPNQKFIALSVETDEVSYGRHDLTLSLQRVFDP